MSYLLGQYAQWTSAYPIATVVTTIFIQLLLIVATIQLISQHTSRRDIALTSRLWRLATVLAVAILPLNIANHYWKLPISTIPTGIATIVGSQLSTLAQSSNDVEATKLNVVANEAANVPPVPADQLQIVSPVPALPNESKSSVLVTHVPPTKLGGTVWRSLIVLYFVGVLWHLARIACSYYLLKRRAIGTTEVEPSFIRQAKKCAQQLSVPRVPSILACSSVHSPYIFGSFWPTLVVPQDIGAWSDDERSAVLAHELAHVKQYDFAWSLLAKLVNAIYWPHPASWWIHRKMLHTRELVADEFAASISVDRRTYASGLVQVVERLSKSNLKAMRESSLAITISAYGDIHQRIQSVLQPKSAVRARIRWLVRFCALATILIVLATSIKLRIVEAQETAQPVNSVIVTSESKPVNPDSIVNRMTVEYTNAPPSASDNDLIALVTQCNVQDNRADTDSIEFNYKGTVVGPDNKPVGGATVVLFEHMFPMRVASQDTNQLGLQDKPFAKLKDVVAKVTTASDGTYEIRSAKSYSLNGYPPEMWQGSIIVSHPERGLGWYTLRFNERDKIDREPIMLEPTTNVSGTYLTPDGKPLPNAVVYVRGFRRNSKNDQTSGVHLGYSQIQPIAITNAEGKFSFSGIPEACIASVYFKHADWGQNWAPCKSTQFEESRYASFPSESPTYANPMTVVAEPDFVFQGRISDAQNRPVFGAMVRVNAAINVAESDQSGRFHLALPIRYVRNALKDQPNAPNMYINPARGSGHLPMQLSLEGIDPSGQLFEKDIELKKGVLVTGQLVDEAGNPTTFINITAVTESGETSQAGTDDEGRFSFYVAPERNRLFFVSFKGGYKLPSYRDTSPFTYRTIGSAPAPDVPEHWKTVAIDAAGKESIAIPSMTVERVPPIEITVTASNGFPAKNAMVMIEDYTKDTSPGATIRPAALAHSAHPVTPEFPTNALGQVSITYPGFLSERAVAITKYTSPAGINYTIKTPLAELQDSKLTVRLETENVLRGRVLLNGKPIAGASVALQENEPFLDAQGKPTHSGATRTILTATTNNDGYYFAAIPPSGKQYYVSLESLPGHNPTRSTDRLSYGVIKRGDGKFYTDDIKAFIYDGEISGVLVDEDGKPIQNATLYISLPQFANEIWGYQPQTTDAKGRFSMKHVPPGKLKLSVRAVGEKQIRQAVQEVSAGDQNIRLQLDSGSILQLISPPKVR